MIELYGMGSPNVYKIIIALEEMELAYRFHFVDVMMGEQYTPEFGALTPNRRVPVIVDAEGPEGRPMTLWESGAILIYLAEKTGLMLPKAPEARYTVLQWLMFQMGGIGPMFGQQSHFRVYAEAHGNHYSRARYGTEVKRLYDVAETRLAQSAYLGGADYSIADAAAWPWMRAADMRSVDLADLPNVARWIKAVGERPAVIRAMATLADRPHRDLPAFVRDHPDELDRYLGRGKYSRVEVPDGTA
jgi:GST-like protein